MPFESPIPEPTLLDAFHLYYLQLEPTVVNAVNSFSGNGLVIVVRLGDDIDAFSTLFNQVSIYYIFV